VQEVKLKKKNVIHAILMVGILVTAFSTAAIPRPGVSSSFAPAEKSELVALTVENRSSGIMYLWLDGPAFYYLTIKSGQTMIFTVERGEYYQKVKACGDTAENIVDITKRTRMIMPVCGGHASQAATSPYVQDISEIIKIVKVTVENDSDTRLLAILTGPSTYVFLIDEGEERDYTIAKGDYSVQYFACGGVATKNFTAYHGSNLSLDCP
jgi:hypothetical protein